MTDRPIYESDVLDSERELFSTPARCENCRDLVTRGDLTDGLCWSCVQWWRD